MKKVVFLIMIIALILFPTISLSATQASGLEGKRVAVCGDSIAWGQVASNPAIQTINNWPVVFSGVTNSSVTNLAIPGSTMAVGYGYGWLPEYDAKAFCNLVDTVDFSSYDYLFVGYVTNDYGFVINMGDDDPAHPKTTFKGALHYSLKKLSQDYPNLKVTILTPMYASTSEVKNQRGFTMSEYIDALEDVTRQYNIPMIDLHHGMGINQYNYQTLYWDPLHPNEETYIRMGNFIAQSFPGVAGTKKNKTWNPISFSPTTSTFGYPTPSWHKDNEQFIHFTGRASVGTSNNIGILPPEALQNYNGGAITTMVMTTDGTVTFIVIDSYGNMSCGLTNKVIDLSSIPPYFAGTVN